MMIEEENKKTSINVYYTIKENFPSEEIIYHPREMIEFDKYNICPQNKSLLEFYKNNRLKYKEKISDHVKAFICFSPSYTTYNIRTGNYIKVSKNGIEKFYYLTSFSLLIPPECHEQESRLEVFMIGNLKEIKNLIKAADELTSLSSIWNKQKFITEHMIKHYDLKRMCPDLKMMKTRIEFIKWAEENNQMHLFHHPVSERMISPALDLLILTQEANEDEDKSKGIEIDLDNLDTKGPSINNYVTFVTYHIPRERAERYYCIPQKIKVLQKFAKQNNLTNYVKTEKHLITYANLRDPFFDDNVCIFYEKTINFGSLSEFTRKGGLKCGTYSFNSQSAGTILFDLNLKPIGIACHGSFDFYPQLQQNSNEYNVYIPLNHPGVLFFFIKLLDLEYSQESYKNKHKQIFPTAHSKGKIFHIDKQKPKLNFISDKENCVSLDEFYDSNVGIDHMMSSFILSKEENAIEDRTISIENNEETNLSNKQQEEVEGKLMRGENSLGLETNLLNKKQGR